MTWVESLRDHIATNDLGEEGTTLFIGEMDDQGQDVPVVGVTMYKGTTRETMGSNGLDVPMFHVGVRSPSYADAYARITAIRDLLRAITDQTIEGTHFVRVQPDGTVKDLKRDEKGRQMFTADFEVWINA